MPGCKFEAARAEEPCSGILRGVGVNKTKLISSSFERDKKQLQNHSGQGTGRKPLRMSHHFF